jgi:hypothetical protein
MSNSERIDKKRGRGRRERRGNGKGAEREEMRWKRNSLSPLINK